MNNATATPNPIPTTLSEMLPFNKDKEPFGQLAKFMLDNPGAIPIVECLVKIMPILTDNNSDRAASWVWTVIELATVMYNSPIPVQQPQSDAGKLLQVHLRARYPNY